MEVWYFAGNEHTSLLEPEPHAAAGADMSDRKLRLFAREGLLVNRHRPSIAANDAADADMP